MLRITESVGESRRLRIEGRIVGAWVDELCRSWEAAEATGTPITIDLTDVQFVDREGLALLLRLRERGVLLENCSGLVSEQLRAAAALRGSDAEALTPERLIERFAAPVYRIAFAITGEVAAAEDVVRRVLLALTAAPGRGFATRANLYRAAVASALEACRVRRRAGARPLEDSLPAFDSDGHRRGDAGALAADWSGAAEHDLRGPGFRASLRNAMDSLPDAHLGTLVLSDVERLSTAEIASILGEPVRSVRERLHAARMAIREQLTRHHVATVGES
jgi:RNA polymerase sigma-70 factor (ECF subfamily)